MPVHHRLIQALRLGSHPAIGAVADTDSVFVAFPAGTDVGRLKTDLGLGAANRRATGRSVLGRFPRSSGIQAAPAEPHHFEGRNTLVAFRNGETASAVAEWLTYHRKQIGAQAALIFDRDPPGRDFTEALTAEIPDLPVVVVSADTPLGLTGAPDARHPSLAPSAPRREMPPVDPWHAPIGQLVIYEFLRHTFLSQAAAVLFLNPADLILPDTGSTAFERVRQAKGKIVPLQGIECYPWRLRQGRAAPHSDHIALRRKERRRLASWGAAPAAMPTSSVWKPVTASGAEIHNGEPIRFRRAMGVVFAGVPVNALVRKGDLEEEPELLAQMEKAFDASPVRLPQRGTIPPRPESSRVTVVSAMKNEGPFVLDWVAHNRAIGIDHHLIYTNDCADGTDALLDALSEAGVTRRDNPFREMGKVPQHAAFRAAEGESIVEQADWLLTLDVDEYINIHTGQGCIGDLLAAAPEAHLFSMPWRLFGNADIHGFEDRPVVEQFPLAAPEYAPRPLQAWAFKTLYRNAGLFRRMGVHRPKGLVPATQGALCWVDGSGRDIPPAIQRGCWRMSKANWGYDLVTLNHYAVRSAESFLVKRDRGRVNHTDRDQGAAYWFRMNHNAVEDTSIARHAPRVTEEKARLMALPGVADLHAASVAWHRDRIAILKNRPEHATLFAEITGTKLQNLSRMSTNFGARVHYYGPHVIPDEFALRDPSLPFFFTVDAQIGDARRK